jgi:hypothetical protein
MVQAPPEVEEAPLASSAFAGFGLIARRPLMLLAWWLGALALLGILVGSALLLARTARPAAFVLHLSGPVGAPLLWLAATVLICAVLRLVLRPSEGHRVGLRFGPDELRLAPLVLVVGLIAGMLLLLLSGPQRLAATAVLLLVSPFVCLIGPAVFVSRRADLLQGWRLARGRYTALLGMNLVTWGVYATLNVLIDKVWKWLVIVNDERINRAIHHGTGAVAWLLVVGGALAVLIYGALLVIVTAPSAEAYRRLTSPPAPGP